MSSSTVALRGDGTDRLVPKIPISAVKQQAVGHCWAEYELRLPKGTELSDIYERPELFSGIQGSRLFSFRRLDRIRIIPFDESFVAEAYVTGASDAGVNLSTPKKVEITPRTENLFQDGTYAIRWAGSGYEVVRMKDQTVMTTIFANQQLAHKALLELYPKTAA